MTTAVVALSMLCFLPIVSRQHSQSVGVCSPHTHCLSVHRHGLWRCARIAKDRNVLYNCPCSAKKATRQRVKTGPALHFSRTPACAPCSAECTEYGTVLPYSLQVLYAKFSLDHCIRSVCASITVIPTERYKVRMFYVQDKTVDRMESK